MMRTSLVALLLVAAAGPSNAGEAPEPQMTWRLQFGAQSIDYGYGLTLSYRAGALGDAPVQLASLDVSDRATLARLAGVPLFQRDYRVAQDEAKPEFRVALSQPWYAKSWVWWTAGGLAATGALLGGAESGSSEEDSCPDSGCPSVQGNVGPVVFDDEGDVGTSCTGQDCVVCPNGDIVSNCNGGGFVAPDSAALGHARDPDRDVRLDAGTGGMGDLVAR